MLGCSLGHGSDISALKCFGRMHWRCKKSAQPSKSFLGQQTRTWADSLGPCRLPFRRRIASPGSLLLGGLPTSLSELKRNWMRLIFFFFSSVGDVRTNAFPCQYLYQYLELDSGAGLGDPAIPELLLQAGRGQMWGGGQLHILRITSQPMRPLTAIWDSHKSFEFCRVDPNYCLGYVRGCDVPLLPGKKNLRASQSEVV